LRRGEARLRRLALSFARNQNPDAPNRHEPPSNLLWENPEARLVLDSMSEMFLVLDRAFQIVFVNRALAASGDKGYEGLVGRNHWELFPDMRGTVVEESYERAFATGVPVRFEYFYPPVGVWVDVNAYPYGQYLHVYFKDTTEIKRAESERARWAAALQAMVDGFPQIAWAAGPDLAPTYLNRRWYEYTGFSPDDPYDLTHVIPPEDLDAIGAKTVAAAGGPVEHEIRLRRYDGALRWHLVRMEPHRDADGSLLGYFGTSTDVHDLKAAEETLVATTDAVPVMIAYIDADLVYRFCNRLYEEWFERPRSEIVGRHVREVVGESAFQTVLPFLHRVLAGERIAFAEWLVYPHRGRRFTQVSYVPRTAEDGRVEGLYALVVDATPARLAQEALQASEEGFRTLFEGAGVGMAEVDPDTTTFVVVNRALADMLGYSKEELVGRSPRDFSHPEDINVGREEAEAIRLGLRSSGTWERRYQRKNGETIWLLVRATRVSRGAQGKPTNLGVYVDITERKTAEGALRFLVDLEEATRAQDDPATIMAIVARMLGEHLKADRCAYAEVESDEDHFTIQGDYTVGDAVSIVGRYAMAAFGARALADHRQGKTFVVNDVDRDVPHPEEREAYRLTQIQAVVSVPLMKRGRFVAGMAVHQRVPRQWTAGEIELVEMVVDRCWSSIEQIRSARAVRESEERYRFLAESSPDIVFTAGPEGTVDYVNSRWVSYFGYGFEEARERGWAGVVHPDDHEASMAVYRRQIAQGQPIEVEYRLRSNDGQFRWHICRMEPMRDEAGRVQRWFGTITDIHDQKSRERALEIINQVGRSLAEDLDLDRIVQALTDASTEVTGAEFGAFFYNVENAAGEILFLYTLSGAPREAFAGFEMPRATAVFGPTFRGEGVVRSDDITKDPRYGQMGDPHHGMPKGHLPVISYLAIPVFSRSGEVLGGLFFGHSEPGRFTPEHERLVASFASQAAVALDNARLYERVSSMNEELERRVTERTAELEAANREMEGFTYSISHDLRAPLRAIVSSSRMLEEDFGPQLTPEANALLERQRSAALKMATLIEDLLNFSRIGRQEIRKRAIDLSALAADVVEEYGEGCSVEVQPGMEFQGDPALIRLVLQNLIENACKYSPGGGRVRVGTVQTDEGLAYFVADQGIGFDMQYAERIFRPFERLHRDGEFEGTGIGLANVRRIVERHGGKVWAESTPGQGSTFYFTGG
jgi:PAS domain S-box-containing protein